MGQNSGFNPVEKDRPHNHTVVYPRHGPQDLLTGQNSEILSRVHRDRFQFWLISGIALALKPNPTKVTASLHTAHRIDVILGRTQTYTDENFKSDCQTSILGTMILNYKASFWPITQDSHPCHPSLMHPTNSIPYHSCYSHCHHQHSLCE